MYIIAYSVYEMSESSQFSLVHLFSVKETNQSPPSDYLLLPSLTVIKRAQYLLRSFLLLTDVSPHLEQVGNA